MSNPHRFGTFHYECYALMEEKQLPLSSSEMASLLLSKTSRRDEEIARAAGEEWKVRALQNLARDKMMSRVNHFIYVSRNRDRLVQVSGNPIRYHLKRFQQGVSREEEVQQHRTMHDIYRD